MSHDQIHDNSGNDDPASGKDDFATNAGSQGLGVGLRLDGFGDEARTDSDRVFQFTTAGGTVTAIQAVDDGRTVNLHIPSDATFTVGAGIVTETLTGTHSTTTIDFTAETSNPALFQVTSTTTTVNSPTTLTGDDGARGFSFTVTGGAVTAEQVTFTQDGHSHSANVPIPADAEFTVGTGTITETLAHGDAVETLTFVQPAGQTLFALASDQTHFISQGSATTALNIEPGERDLFTFGAGGAVTAAERVHADGSTSAIAIDSHVSFTQLASGLVEEIDTFGNHSSFEVFATGAGGGGVYTAIAHGEGTAVDVTGLNAQLSQLPSFFTHLI